VRLELLDDGSGLAADWSQRNGHYGLRWLTERAEALNGSARIEPAEPHGVRLTMELPLAPPVAAAPANTAALEHG
jgi:two-component system sensor histidine kinase UhpB